MPRAGLEPARDCSRGILSLAKASAQRGLRGQNGTERERKRALGEWGLRLIPPQSEEVRHSCGTMGKRFLSDRLWVRSWVAGLALWGPTAQEVGMTVRRSNAVSASNGCGWEVLLHGLQNAGRNGCDIESSFPGFGGEGPVEETSRS
jgi:hypothetical protein